MWRSSRWRDGSPYAEDNLTFERISLVFLKSPSGETAEDQLLAQFQGMIAEYERAQIMERTRRGKRHRAQQGLVNVLSGAPYGYRYVRKSENADAYFEVNEAEAAIVLSSAVPIEPPTCCIVLTVADATPASS